MNAHKIKELLRICAWNLVEVGNGLDNFECDTPEEYGAVVYYVQLIKEITENKLDKVVALFEEARPKFEDDDEDEQ